MQPIRRLHWAGALAVLLLAIAVVALWQLLDERRVRSELEARLTALVGRPVSVRGPIEYTLVPALTFDVRGIEVAGASGTGGGRGAPLLAIGRVQGSVRAGSLVSGRVDVGDVRLERVQALLAVDAAGRPNWTGLFPPGEPGGEGAALRWSLASVTLVDGALEYRDARDGSRYALRDWGLELGRVELPQPVDVRMRGRALVADAERVRFELRGQAAIDPEAGRHGIDDLVVEANVAREGAAPRMPVRLDARRIEYSAATGTAAVRRLVASALGATATLDLVAESLATTPRASGSIAIAPFAPRAVAEALAVRLPPTADPAVLARADFSGRIAYGSGLLRLDGVRAALDDTRLDGDVVIALEPREYRFELTADRIVADGYLKPKRLRDRTPVELPLDFLRGLPATGRLRIGELVLEGTRLKGVTVDLGDVARGAR